MRVKQDPIAPRRLNEDPERFMEGLVVKEGFIGSWCQCQAVKIGSIRIIIFL